MERIEVLKGPSSVLYGQNDPGGIINIVTKRPLETPFYEFEAQVGNDDLLHPSLDFTGPLNEDGSVRCQTEKIVVLGPYFLEQVLALGKQLAGYGDHIAFHQGDYDNPPLQIPYLGSRVTTQPVNVGLAYQPSIEAIFKVKPDLILAPGYETAQYETLANIAPTISLEIAGGKTNLEQIGLALGLSDRAKELEVSTKAMVEDAKKQFAPVVQVH